MSKRTARALLTEQVLLGEPVEEAERRVMILENPGLPGKSQITGSLYAGLQLIMPGEIAPTHRHVPSALRVSGCSGSVTLSRLMFGSGMLTQSWAFTLPPSLNVTVTPFDSVNTT